MSTNTEQNQHATEYEKVAEAERLLKKARDLLKEAGASRAVNKVRRALKSVGGAMRHAAHAPYRNERQRAKRARAQKGGSSQA